MRIRSIKPEFWRSHDIAQLDLPDRLLFIGLWSYVDDNAVGRDHVSHIAADLFAADLEVDPVPTLARVRRGLAALSDAGLIARYEVDGKPFLAIVAWWHQKIDRPSKPRYPEPASPEARGSDGYRRGLDEPSTSPRAETASVSGDQGIRGSEDQVTTPPADAAVESVTAPADEVTPEKLAKVASKASRLQKLADETFDAFWDAWPTTMAKGAARKAWRVAVRNVDGDVDRILRAVRGYAADDVLPDDPQFIPYPASWLNAQRWDDDLAMLRARKAANRARDAGPVRQTAADRNREITEARKRDEAARQRRQGEIDAGDQGSDDGSGA